MTTKPSITIYSGRPSLLKQLPNHLVELPYTPSDVTTYISNVIGVLTRDGRYNRQTLFDNIAWSLHVQELSAFWYAVCKVVNVENVTMYCTSQRLDVIGALTTEAYEFPDIDVKYIRLQERDGRIEFVEYTLDEVRSAIYNDIEIR
jgi:hypothetical protein